MHVDLPRFNELGELKRLKNAFFNEFSKINESKFVNFYWHTTALFNQVSIIIIF
jgi:hypothetical protein